MIVSVLAVLRHAKVELMETMNKTVIELNANFNIYIKTTTINAIISIYSQFTYLYNYVFFFPKLA